MSVKAAQHDGQFFVARIVMMVDHVVLMTAGQP